MSTLGLPLLCRRQSPFPLLFSAFCRVVVGLVCRCNARLGFIGVRAVVSSDVKALNSKFKVLNSVIRLVTVDVVDHFLGKQVAPNMSSHDNAVFTNVSVGACHWAIRHPNKDIALAANGASALPAWVIASGSRPLKGLGEFLLGFFGVVESLSGKAGRLPLRNNLRCSLVGSAHESPHFCGKNTGIHNNTGNA